MTLLEVLACSGVAGLEMIPKIAGKGNVSPRWPPPRWPRGGRFNAKAITAVAARLEDADVSVRATALNALGKIAEKGNAGVITAVSTRLEDAHENVRAAASLVLERIAE